MSDALPWRDPPMDQDIPFIPPVQSEGRSTLGVIVIAESFPNNWVHIVVIYPK